MLGFLHRPTESKDGIVDEGDHLPADDELFEVSDNLCEALSDLRGFLLILSQNISPRSLLRRVWTSLAQNLDHMVRSRYNLQKGKHAQSKI